MRPETVVIRPGDSELLASVRDIHVRMVALLERQDLAEFLAGYPEIAEELRSSERFLGLLRTDVALRDNSPVRS